MSPDQRRRKNRSADTIGSASRTASIPGGDAMPPLLPQRESVFGGEGHIPPARARSRRAVARRSLLAAIAPLLLAAHRPPAPPAVAVGVATGSPATPAATLTPAVPVSMAIANGGTIPDRLVAASSPIAERIGLRRSEGFGEHRRETPLPDGIPIPAGSLVILEPLGDHLALAGLRVPLAQGETFPLDLMFERAGPVAVTGRVRRKQDAAGVAPIPPAAAGDLTITLVSAPPAPGPHPATPADPAATPAAGTGTGTG